MNQGNRETAPAPQFELPSAPENDGAGQPAESRPSRALERGAPDEQRVGRQQPALPPVTATPVQLPTDDDTQAATDDQTAAAASSGGHPAHDADRIEKVWVDKAKAVISKTQDDPFAQKREMSKVKAEYIQKRFNKTIPTDAA